VGGIQLAFTQGATYSNLNDTPIRNDNTNGLLTARANDGLALRMPQELRPLELAYDLWWSWHPGGPELFRDVDPYRWETCGKNPGEALA
jgi:hypothetical protein